MVSNTLNPSSKGDGLKEKESTVAVLVVETFNNNFQPLFKYDPLALMPLVNSPLLDYSLDWLQRCEVDETIVYCCSYPHSEKIREHCRQWSLRYGNAMKVTVISSENCTSLGDAMRDLYSKSLLKNDFILMTGAVIGNLDLPLIMKKHKSAAKKDPNCVMSCVYLKNCKQEKDSSRVINLIINSKTGKILSHSRPGKSSKMVLPTEIIQLAPKLKVLPRMEDPMIAICSQMIPSLFSDNFDYGTRDSLVQGLIEQEELLGCTIHAQVIKEGYAAVVTSFKSYEEIRYQISDRAGAAIASSVLVDFGLITKDKMQNVIDNNDVIKRKVFPSVPERSLSSQRIRYLFHPFSGSYWESSAKFHKRSVGENVVIDAGTEIDPRCRIRNSVVGKHCVIRENVTINDSFLLSNVTVNKGCILDTCFIGSDAKLLPGVHLEPGVVIGSKSVLGPNLKVNCCNRLVDEPWNEEDEEVKTEINPLVCGKEGRAFVYTQDDDDDDGIRPARRWGEQPTKEEESSDDEVRSDTSSEESDGEEGEGEENEVSSDEEREQEFVREVKDSLMNAYKNKSALENVILEVNSSRHAYNVSMENLLETVTKASLQVVAECSENRLTGEELWHNVKKGLRTFGELIRNYIKKAKDQVVVLNAIENLGNEDSRFLLIMQRIFFEFNQELDLLDDEVILYWFSRNGARTKAFPQIAKNISKFIQWIRENEKDDEEETESDED